MDGELKKEVVDRMARELRLIHEFVDNLEEDDVEQSVRNARSALEGGTTLQLENMVHNHYYHAGANHVKNEIRELLGLPRLYARGEKEQLERLGKSQYADGRWYDYDCPELPDSEYSLVDKNVKVVCLGEEQDTVVVFGTKSGIRALQAIRKIERDEWGLDAEEGFYGYYKDEADKLPTGRIVWRRTDDEERVDYSTYWSWSERDTKNNPKAVDCFILTI